MRMAFGAYLAHTPFYAFINALVGLCLIYLFFVLIFARLPLSQNNALSQSSKFSDISFICFIAICLFYFRGFGSVFYWAAGSFNYLWAWTIILIYLVPFRLFIANLLAQKPINSQNDEEAKFTKAIFMLILGLFAGWASELGIVIVLFQALFIAFALYKKAKLPLWCYAGLLGFVAGWCILYFSPGHKNRGNLIENVLKQNYYKSLSTLLSMPFVDIFSRFVGTFKNTLPQMFIAAFGILVFLKLKFGKMSRKFSILLIFTGVLLILSYAFVDTRWVFLLLGLVLAFVCALLLRKENSPQSLYLLILSALFLAYFIASAITLQVPLPPRAQLPYTFIACASVIMLCPLLKPYFAKFSHFIGSCVIILCALYALFVFGAGVDMRFKWEKMLSSIQTQQAMGLENIVVDSDTFHSYYKGYGDWGNPGDKIDEWPNTTYAEVFGAKTFNVRGFKNVKKD